MVVQFRFSRFCDEELKTAKQLWYHEREEHGPPDKEPKYKCQHCPKIFRIKGVLSQHKILCEYKNQRMDSTHDRRQET